MALTDAASLVSYYYYGDEESISTSGGSPLEVENGCIFAVRVYISGAALTALKYKQPLWSEFKTLSSTPPFIDINPGDKLRFEWDLTDPTLSWHPI